MIKNENKKINKIEKLVEIIATNIFKLTDKVDNIEKDVVSIKKDIEELKKDTGELKKDTGELKEGNKNIREDILNLGDRFPSQFAFDQLSSRVYNLEKKNK
jgi:peptidoglycan hydrolase CwlO-like protein